MARVNEEELKKLQERIAASRSGVQLDMAQRQYDASHGSRRRWSNATPSAVGDEKFPSKMEARVYQRLVREYPSPNVIYRQVRLPLLSIAPESQGRPAYITIDFVVKQADQSLVYIDAKGGRVSRDWKRGRLAFEAQYGPLIECDR